MKGETVASVFSRLEPVSIDYGVMEKTARAAVVPADSGWSDVGSWTALEEVTDKDASGHIITGNVIDIGSTESVIYAEKRLVATIGLRDTIVVDTPDATLVCSRDRAQDVKTVVEELRKRKAEEHLTHRTVHRPWGNYTILEEGDRYKIKRIVVVPGAKLSHRLHHHRSVHWVVVSGTARVANGDKEYDVQTNASSYKPFKGVAGLQFSPDGKRLAYVGARGGHWQEQTELDSEMGSASVLMSLQDEKWVVVVDGKEGPEFDGIGTDAKTNLIAFSSDSQRVGYGALRRGKWMVVLDGKEGPEFDGIGGGPPLLFSPDCRRVAYVAIRGGKYLAVVDGNEGPESDNIRRSHPIFSPDSERFFYAATRNARLHQRFGARAHFVRPGVGRSPRAAEIRVIFAGIAWSLWKGR